MTRLQVQAPSHAHWGKSMDGAGNLVGGRIIRWIFVLDTCLSPKDVLAFILPLEIASQILPTSLQSSGQKTGCVYVAMYIYSYLQVTEWNETAQVIYTKVKAAILLSLQLAILHNGFKALIMCSF